MNTDNSSKNCDLDLRLESDRLKIFMKRKMKICKIFIGTIFLFLIGCARHGDTAGLNTRKGVSVNIHGVNYTAEPFEFVIVDPNDASNIGGGEHIGPFSAGGLLCCFKVPEKWTAGIKVKVLETYWTTKNEKKGELSEEKGIYTLELPPYLNGNPGELWILRTVGGAIEIVSSDLQPDHPQWPGKIKGWPIPSREYRLQRWRLYRSNAQATLNSYRKLVAGLNSDTKAKLNEQWEYSKEHYDKETEKFSGPADPAYERFLREDYARGLREAETQLKKLDEEKP